MSATIEGTDALVTGLPRRAPSESSGLADPSPLGLVSYALTLGVLSFIHLGILSAATTPLVVAMALPVGGLGMLLAGMWAFRRGNTFAGTALTGYGVFWVNYYLLFGGLITKIPAADRGHALALWLVFWGLFTVILAIGSLAIDRAHPIFLSLLVVTFFALAIGQWTGVATFIKLGGWTGLASIAGALYVAAAQLFAAQFKRVILHV